MQNDTQASPPRLGLASLPVFFNLAGKRVLVAGGSAAAAWKAELLLAAGAKVHVFCGDASPKLRALAQSTDGITLVPRDWQDGDFTEAALAVADCASDAQAAQFRNAARRAGVPVNVIDKPLYCDFQFGTIVDRSPLIIAISTSGAAPVFALALRGRLEALLPGSLKLWVEAARSWRPKLGPIPARRFWELFATRALSAGAPRDEDFTELRQAAEKDDAPTGGALTIITIANADPEDLTLRALRLLQAGETVFYDEAVPPRIVAMARRESERIAAAGPEAIAQIIAQAQDGRRVVWLTRADPAANARARIAAAGIGWQLVPGPTAGPAALGAEPPAPGQT